MKSHISSLQLTTPSCCGSDRGNWVQTEKMKGQTTEASLGCYCDFLPQVPHSPPSPSPTLKLSEAMCSLHYKGFCSRMRHPSLPSDVFFFLHLLLTLSQFLRMSQRQGSTLHLHPNMRKCLIYKLARTKKQSECN